MATLAQRAASAVAARQTTTTVSQTKDSGPKFSAAAQFDEVPIGRVQVDGMAVLKMLKGGSGQLLGLDTAGTLDVSDVLPLPAGCLFPLPERPDDRDRDAYYRRKEDSFDAAANAAANHTAQYLPRLTELNSDANLVGFYTSVTNGQVAGVGGAVVEALARYQAGSSDAGATKGKVLPSKIAKVERKLPGKGVALVYDSTASASGTISLRAFRLSEAYMEVHKSGRFDTQSMTANQIIAANILREYPVTITRTSLLSAFLSSLAAPAAETESPSANASTSTTRLPSPSFAAFAPPSTTSTGAGSLAGPLQSLLTNFESSVNILGNMRYRDRKANNKVGQDSQLDAIRALAASEGAAKTLGETSGLALVHAFAARASVEG